MPSINQIPGQNINNAINVKLSPKQEMKPDVAVAADDKAEMSSMSQKLNQAQKVSQPLAADEAQNKIPSANDNMFTAYSGGISAEFVASLLDTSPYSNNEN